jgi:hypothetical protein
MCRQAGSSPTIISSRSSKGSDYAEVPHGGWPENKVLANAMRHNPGYGIMRQFVCERGIVVIEPIEQADWRHRHAIRSRFIVCLAALVAQINGDGSEEGVELGLAPFGLDKLQCRGWMKALGKPFDLIGIEDRIGLQHPARFIGLFAGIGGFHLFGVALVEDRDGRLLALADLGAKRLGLVIRHPER